MAMGGLLHHLLRSSWGRCHLGPRSWVGAPTLADRARQVHASASDRGQPGSRSCATCRSRKRDWSVQPSTGQQLTSSGAGASEHDSSTDFQRAADQYLAGLRLKVESGLKPSVVVCACSLEAAGGGLVIRLPDRVAEIRIRKDSATSALMVQSDLHVTLCRCGSYDTAAEVPFRLKGGRFETEGETPHSFLEYGLAKHLKIEVDLAPAN